MRPLYTLVGSVVLALSSCRGTSPLAITSPDILPLAWEARYGVTPLLYDVSIDKRLQTVPVHPSDAPFLFGTTTTDLDNGYDFGLLGGLEGFLDIPSRTRLSIGADLRFNLFSISGGAYRTEISDWKQQSSDRRHPSQGSFVFSQLTPDPFTVIPFLGLEHRLSDDFLVGVEVGLPYSGFTARRGHDRFGRWETIAKEEWSGIGTSIAAEIGVRNPFNTPHTFVGLVFGYEDYDTRLGDIKNYSFMLSFRH